MVAAIGHLEVEQLHAESAPGQFEIVTAHKDALEVSLLALLSMQCTAEQQVRYPLSQPFQDLTRGGSVAPCTIVNSVP